MTYKEAAEFITARRKREKDRAAAYYADALKHNPELLETETDFRALVLKEAKEGKINKKLIAELGARKRDILAALKITDSMLNPPPHCKICGDAAYVKGAYCGCVKALALNDAANVEIPYQSFFEIDYNRLDPEHRDRNAGIFESVRIICERYPLNKRRIIVILGGTGTGKTLLAGCATAEMIQKGFPVMALTAFGFNNRMLKYHTSPNEEKAAHLDPLLDSALLVIDDLGTETILNNVTHEYLYLVLNERLNAKKLTMITTNLSHEGILSRYGERIASRLFDKNLGYSDALGGKDLRT